MTNEEKQAALVQFFQKEEDQYAFNFDLESANNVQSIKHQLQADQALAVRFWNMMEQYSGEPQDYYFNYKGDHLRVEARTKQAALQLANIHFEPTDGSWLNIGDGPSFAWKKGNFSY